MDNIVLSQKRINALEKELKVLQKSLTEKRSEQAKRGGAADSWHETASFAATDGTLEQKITNIQSILRSAKVLPEQVNSPTIVIGSKVVLQDNNGNKTDYRLVHPIEANPEKNLLSIESPLGKMLLGKKVGDTIMFNTTKYNVVSL